MEAPLDFRSNPLHRAFWENSWIIGCILVFSFFAALLQMTVPLFMLLIYDRVVPARSLETLVSLLILALAMLALMTVLDFARRRLLARFGGRIQEQVEDAASLAVSRHVPMVNAKEVRQLDDLRAFYHSFAAVALIDILWVPIFVAAVFTLHPWFGFTALIGMALLVAIYGLGAVFTSYRKSQASVARNRVSELVASTKRSKDVISQQRLSGSVHHHWKDARAQSRITAILAKDRVAAVSALLRMVRMMFTVAILFVGASLVLQAKITTGAMVAGVVLLNRVFMPVVNFCAELPAILTARTRWKELSQAFDTAADDAAVTPSAIPEKGSMVLEQVTLYNDHDKTSVLRNIMLDIPAGSLVEITGPTGSGKSLLALALLGLKRPRAGSIQIGGVDLRHASSEDLSGQFGYMPQDHRFMRGTIAENIASFSPDIDMDAVRNAAGNARAHDMIQSIPMGYHTELDEIGAQFSQGQRQLIALARALYKAPRILILDEPGSILNEAFDSELGPSIKAYLKDGNSILVLGRHPYSLIPSATRYVIQNKALKPAMDAANLRNSQVSGPKLVKPAS